MSIRSFSRNASLPFLAAALLVSSAGAAPPAARPAAAESASAAAHARSISTVALTVASSISGAQSAVTLLAKVDGQGAAPGGSVEFLVGGKRVGEAPVANGSALLTVQELPNGLSSLSASYTGDNHFLPSKSATVKIYRDE